jgi:hypothetical protein
VSSSTRGLLLSVMYKFQIRGKSLKNRHHSKFGDLIISKTDHDSVFKGEWVRLEEVEEVGRERERERDFIPLVFHLLISFFNMSTEERRTYSLE